MDSYNRIKGNRIKIPKEIDGKIELYVSKTGRGKEQKGVIAVVDWAEGIPPDKMEKYIKGYGERTSGKETFRNIRGYFGRGLKDAAGGLDGIGTIQSVYNGTISIGIIDGSDKNMITYEEVKTFPATKDNLKKFRLENGARTIAMVEFPTEQIALPRFDTFAEKLTLCVELRPIMELGNVRLIQIEKGNIIRERNLKYNPPHGKQLLLETNNKIPDENARYDIEICKSEEPLSQGEDGKFREGGLLIMSGNVVHESTLLKFERDPNASKFFGKVRCDYIDELMKKDEAVVTPDRQGLNWEHPFMIKLKKEIENKLQPFVEIEKKERDKHKRGVSEDALKRNERIGKKLGRLYKEIMKEEIGEFGTLGGGEISEEGGILKPSGGFGFIPPYYLVENDKEQKIRLIVESPKVIPSYEKIRFVSTNENIEISKGECFVSDGKYIEEEGLFVHLIKVYGRSAGQSGEIIAITKDKIGKDRIAKAQIDIKEMNVYPPDGFSFDPTEYKAKIEKPAKLTLKIDGNLIDEDSMEIKVESDNKYIVVEEPHFTIPKAEGIIKKNIVVKGNRSGEIGNITAVDVNNPSRMTEAKVKVVSTTSTSAPKGFVTEFDNTPHPIQRAVCLENTIYIYVNEPTVKMYYGNGNLVDTLSFQILCADLITDAFCTKVVEDLSKGKLRFLRDDEDARRSKLNELKMKIGPVIHQTYVNKSLLERDREYIQGD